MAQKTIVIEVPGTPISELDRVSSVSRNDVTPVVQNEETKQADIGQISDFVKSELGSAALKNVADFATPASVSMVAQNTQQRMDSISERVDNVEFGQTALANGADASFATYAEMIAYVPSKPNVSVRNNDPDSNLQGTYIWTGDKYVPGYDSLDEAVKRINKAKNEAVNEAVEESISYSDTQKVQIYRALNRPGVLYEITDSQGNQTWLQVSSEDGLPTEFAVEAIRKSASIDESKVVILKDGALLYCVPDSNGNPTAISVRQSDGMFPDFVIENIQKRLSLDNTKPDLNDLQYKQKPSDFQIISSIARGVARYIEKKPLPAHVTNFVNSTNQPCTLTFANSYNDATPLIFVICFEGVGDFENLNIRDAYSDVLNHGVVWARCRFHGDSYGSPKAMADAAELYRKACEIAPIAGCIVVGNSMGGIAALNCLTTEAVPNVLGVYLTDPTYDLRQRYDNGRANEINAAYECDATTYAEKTKGYDPALKHWSEFKGVPFSIVATSNDSLVYKALHTDKLVATLGNHNKVSVLDTKAGWHNHPDEFIVSRLINFINQCASGEVITQI